MAVAVAAAHAHAPSSLHLLRLATDLDDCLWNPEMYTLSNIPTKPVRGELGADEDGAVPHTTLPRAHIANLV